MNFEVGRIRSRHNMAGDLLFVRGEREPETSQVPRLESFSLSHRRAVY